LAALDVARAQAAARQDAAINAQSPRSGAWTAKSGTGLTLGGTWTAVIDSATGTVTGAWTLADAQGATLASGAWSAAKSPTRWNGAWRAVVAGKDGEYSGTWTSSVDLKADAGFAALFEKAVESVVSGTWRSAGKSGAWSIRAAK